jgi:hypothetical protein
MKFFNHFTSVFLLSLTLLAGTMFTGCNNVAANEEEQFEEHFPVGIVLKMNGQDIVRYENGVTDDSITVAAGEETALISVYFLDEDGEEFQPEEAEHSLAWTIEDDTIAEIEQHAEDGKWSFHVHGVSSGSTTVSFELLHGDHSDFEASGIPIIVN